MTWSVESVLQLHIFRKETHLLVCLFSGRCELNVYFLMGFGKAENMIVIERQRFLCVQGPQNVFNPAFELNLYIELLQIAKLPMLTFQTE